MELLLGFTDKQITPWAGMVLLKRMLDHIGWNEAVLRAQLPQPPEFDSCARKSLIYIAPPIRCATTKESTGC